MIELEVVSWLLLQMLGWFLLSFATSLLLALLILSLIHFARRGLYKVRKIRLRLPV